MRPQPPSPPPARTGSRTLTLAALALGLLAAVPAASGDAPDDCTAIAVGRAASADGSVMVSHTCDSHSGRTWLDVVPARDWPRGSTCEIRMKTDLQRAPGDTTYTEHSGFVPQVDRTHGYVWGFYPLMNEHQLAITESTFGGRRELRSEAGMFNLYEITRLMAERCRTAREAIALADELLSRYGYNDGGECLIIADPEEAWYWEVVGPGEGEVGVVWAARRVPDGHVTVNANGSRLLEIDPRQPDQMASENHRDVAVRLGLWDPESGEPFRWAYAYGSRKSLAARRREWRVFSLLAPSLDLDPNGENFPFSIAPERPVTVQDLVKIYQDTYEDTPFDMTKFMLVEDDEGSSVKSPYANPFMDYDQMPLWKINGGWNELGERTIARQYCVYAFVAQCRSWLPDPVGGVMWFAYDNPAMACYAPLYSCATRLPESFRVGGDGAGGGRPAYTRDSAWWAMNRVAGLAAHRWGDMRHDVAAVRDPLLVNVFSSQAAIERTAVELHGGDPARATEFLTDYGVRCAERVVEAYWELGDRLWTKWDEKF